MITKLSLHSSYIPQLLIAGNKNDKTPISFYYDYQVDGGEELDTLHTKLSMLVDGFEQPLNTIFKSITFVKAITDLTTRKTLTEVGELDITLMRPLICDNAGHVAKASSSVIIELVADLRTDIVLPESVKLNLLIKGIEKTYHESQYVLKTTTVQDALKDYEELIKKLTNEEISSFESTYKILDEKRNIVKTAILGLSEEEEKTTLLNRYNLAASNQYTAFKIMLSHFSLERYVNIAKVKNLGGNTPYSVLIKENKLIGESSEAWLFYPDGYRAMQSGQETYPNDYPDNLKTSLISTEESILIQNDYLKGGEFTIFFKLDGIWTKLNYVMSESGNILESVNDQTINIPEIGNEWLSELESQMNHAVTNSKLVIEAKELIDKSEDLNIIITQTVPVEAQSINPSIVSDLLVTFDKPPVSGSKLEIISDSLVSNTIIFDGIQTKVYLNENSRPTLASINGERIVTLKLSGLSAETFVYSVKALAGINSSFTSNSNNNYTLSTFTKNLQVIDRQAALEDAIVKSELEVTGDTIVTIDESITLTLTNNNGDYLPALDPELLVDTAFVLNKPLPIGATITVTSQDSIIGTYTEDTGLKTILWLSKDICAVGVRPKLIDNSNTQKIWTVAFDKLDDTQYDISVKLITAKVDNFEVIEARTELANVDINFEISDKTELKSLIIEAESLLVKHQVGELPGNVPQNSIDSLKIELDKSIIVKDNTDALINDVTNATDSLRLQVAEFKASIIKNKINKAGLKESIENARLILSSAIIGDKPGEFIKENYDIFSAEILKAQNVVDSTPDELDYDSEDLERIQLEIDNAKISIDSAIITFQSSVITKIDYAEKNLVEYEEAARQFLESVRKKVGI